MNGRTNISGNGNMEINGSVDLFRVADGNSVIAGDFVELTGKNASLNQLRNITNSVCCSAKISDDMMVLFSYSSKATMLSASVVKINQVIKAYSIQLGYSIEGRNGYIKFFAHVEEDRIYLSYLVNGGYGTILNEVYGTDDTPLVRYVTEIKFNANGILEKIKDYPVHFSENVIDDIKRVSGSSNPRFYTCEKIIVHNGYGYGRMRYSESTSDIGERPLFALARFSANNESLEYENILTTELISDSAYGGFDIIGNKLLAYGLFANKEGSGGYSGGNFVLYDIEKNTSKKIDWSSGTNKDTGIVSFVKGNHIFVAIGKTDYRDINVYLFNIETDSSISYVQKGRISLNSGERNLFDFCFLRNGNGEDYLICYTVYNSHTYNAWLVRYNEIENNFSFSDFPLALNNESLRMVYYSGGKDRFAVLLNDGESRSVVYLSSDYSSYSLVASEFIYQDGDIIYAKNLDLVKEYTSRISGVAKTSGSSGQEIQVYVPNSAT